MLTFEQFQATRREVPDVGEVIGADMGGPSPGFVYTGDCYIEKMPDGKFYLLIQREDWISADLAELEARLYAWCLTECDMGATRADWRELLAAIVAGTDKHTVHSAGDFAAECVSIVCAVLDVEEPSEALLALAADLVAAKYGADGGA